MLHAPLPSSVPDRAQNRAATNVGLGVGNFLLKAGTAGCLGCELKLTRTSFGMS